MLATPVRTNIPSVRQAKVNRPPTEEDDEIDDLPPIDGDEVEDEELADEELDETPLDDADPMDEIGRAHV